MAGAKCRAPSFVGPTSGWAASSARPRTNKSIETKAQSTRVRQRRSNSCHVLRQPRRYSSVHAPIQRLISGNLAVFPSFPAAVLMDSSPTFNRLWQSLARSSPVNVRSHASITGWLQVCSTFNMLTSAPHMQEPVLAQVLVRPNQPAKGSLR